MKNLKRFFFLAAYLLPAIVGAQNVDFTYTASASACGTVTLISEITGSTNVSQWLIGSNGRVIVNKGQQKDTVTLTSSSIGWLPFSITAIGSNGSNKVISDSVLIAGQPAFSKESTNLRMCKGGTSAIDLGKGLLISGQTKWLDNSSTSLKRTFTDTVDTVYHVQGTRGSCIQTLEVEVDVIDLQPSFRVLSTTGSGPISVSFENLSSEDADQFLWEFGSAGTTDATIANPTALYQKSGTFMVTLHTQDDDGICKDSISQNIGVWPMSIVHAKSEDADVYPNPTQGLLNIENPLKETLHLVLYSATGEVVKRQTLSTRTQMNLSTNEPGIYFLNVQSERGNYTLRVTLLDE